MRGFTRLKRSPANGMRVISDEVMTIVHGSCAIWNCICYKNPLSMKMFGLSLESIMRQYGQHYMKRRTKLGMQTNLDMTEESSTDWLPKCNDPAAA